MLYKVIIIIIILILIYSIVSENIEKFTDLKYKYPWEREDIFSSIPHDIKSKYEDTYFYEYGNDEYEKKLNLIFNDKYMTENLITIVEGNLWSEWTNKIKNKNKILNYYNKIYNFITNKINNSDLLDLPNNKKSKIIISKDKLISYKYNLHNTNYYMFNIEMILYRKKKLLGKHVRFIVISNNNCINIVNSKIIGVFNEDDMLLKTFNPFEKDDKYSDFINTEIKYYNLNSYIYNDNIYDEKKVNEEINNILYQKLLPNKLFNIPYEKEPDNISYTNNEKYKEEMIEVRNSFLTKLKE